MNLEVYILDPTDFAGSKIEFPINGHNGPLWVQQALSENGIESRIFPTAGDQRTLDKVVDSIPESNDKTLRVAAYASYDDVFGAVRGLSLRVHKKRIIRVAGGPTFADAEENKGFLQRGYFHGINSGGCMPFIEILKRLKQRGKITNWNLPFEEVELPDGFYTMGRNGPIGKGIGKHPKFEVAPLNYKLQHQKALWISIQVDGNCRNRCLYCNSPSIPYQGKRSVLAGYRKVIQEAPETNFVFINIEGNSPLSPYNIENTLNTLKDISKIKQYIWADSYIDPGYIRDDKFRDYVVNSIVDQRILQLCFGFDASTGELAKQIGRHFHGRPRTDRELNEEVESTITLLTEAKEKIKEKYGVKIYPTFHKILSHQDTKESFIVGLNMLYRLGAETLDRLVVPECKYFTLAPYIGTQLRRDTKNQQLKTPPRKWWNWKKKYTKLHHAYIQAIYQIASVTPRTEININPTEFYFFRLAALASCVGQDWEKYIPQNGKGAIDPNKIGERVEKFGRLFTEVNKFNLSIGNKVTAAYYEALGAAPKEAADFLFAGLKT